MRPSLLPGAHVLRRDATTLQVGLDPTHSVRLPDTARHRRLVLEPPAADAGLRPVLLPDDSALRAALPPADDADPQAQWARHSVASRAREHQLTGRSDADIVIVESYGGRLGEPLADDVRTLLRRCALPAPCRRRSGPRPSAAPAELHVLVGVGEPPRRLVDRRVETGTPHLLLRFVEGRAVVGPLVVPGSTACLRCVDLHRTDSDSAWPLLLEQYVPATRDDRPDGIPEPVDAATAAVAVGWVARDVAAHLGGRHPVSLSRTLEMSPDLVEVVLQEWPQRPDCGCVLR